MLSEVQISHLEDFVKEQNINFEYLQPIQCLKQVEPEDPDIHEWEDQEKTKKKGRRLFYHVEFEEKEKQLIAQARQKLYERCVFTSFEDGRILQFLYDQSLDPGKAASRLQSLSQCLYQNPKVHNLSAKGMQHLKNGVAYTLGFTKDLRPIVIIRADRVNSSHSVDEIFNCVYHLFLIVDYYCLHNSKLSPPHNQKYLIMIDLNNMNFSQIPFSLIFGCLDRLSLLTCSATDYDFVLNSRTIWTVWKWIKPFLPERQVKKAIFLEDDKSQLLKYIDRQELEQKYGGLIPDIPDGQYWPPRATQKCRGFSQANRVLINSNQAVNKTYTFDQINPNTLGGLGNDVSLQSGVRCSNSGGKFVHFSEEESQYHSIENDLSFFKVQGQKSYQECGFEDFDNSEPSQSLTCCQGSHECTLF